MEPKVNRVFGWEPEPYYNLTGEPYSAALQ